ncbi:MAG: GNAT family N-acetyltransferase [Gemmatimonadota bacterium]
MREFRIRAAESSDVTKIARVQVATWHTTYTGIIAQESIERVTVADREAALGRALRGETQFVPEAFVALLDEEIVGFVSGGAIRAPISEFDAELYAIYLLQSAQRSGIGRALVKRLTARLHEVGYHSMIVRVLSANPACRFYERLGGDLVLEGEHAFDGHSYPERAYGFSELPVSIDRPF